MPAVFLLVPPSEGKAAPRRGRPLDLERLSFPELRQPRAEALTALVDLCRGDRATARAVLGLPPGLDGEIDRDAALLSAPSAAASTVYTGVLHTALDLPGLPGTARAAATRRLLVASALFGVLRPGDRIPAYRLSGAVTLPGVGRLATHWRAALPSVLRATVGTRLLVDLRSGTYSQAAPLRTIGAPRAVAVRVLTETPTGPQVVSHSNKATKGLLARRLLLSGQTPRTAAALAELVGHLGAPDGWQVHLYPGGPLDVLVPAV